MNDTTTTTTRSWPRDIAILLGAALLGAAIFYLAFGRDGGGGGDDLVSGDDIVASQGDTEDGASGSDPELQVEAGANADVEPVDPADAVDAETAVSSFLAAESQRDFGASFALLAPAVQERVGGSPERWRVAHAQLPTITGFELLGETEQGGEPAVRSVLALDSVLNRVLGLVPARAEAIWVVEETDEGFRVDFDNSVIEPLYPDEDAARDVALEWARAQQAGDATAGLEAVNRLYGRAGLRTVVADSSGDFEAGQPVSLPPNGGDPGLLSAFGADVVGWARAVPLGGAVEVTVVLAPLDDEWRVVGLLDPSVT